MAVGHYRTTAEGLARKPEARTLVLALVLFGWAFAVLPGLIGLVLMYRDPAWTARERTLATLLPVSLVGVALGGSLCKQATALSIVLGALIVIACAVGGLYSATKLLSGR